MIKKKSQIGFLALLVMVVVTVVSCCTSEQLVDTPVVGHWGCEQYVSHRTDSTGLDRWDTLNYEVGPGCAYEIFFYNTGKGLLKLNNSPAFIKEFSCDYVYDSVARQVTVESGSWLLGLYGSLFHDTNTAMFDIEAVTDSAMVASWINSVSEPLPFFERFFLKRID